VEKLALARRLVGEIATRLVPNETPGNAGH